MSRTLLDYDADTCVATYSHDHNDDTGTVTLETTFDAKPLMERNLKLRNEGVHDRGNEGWHKIADVDDVMIKNLLDRGCNILRPQPEDWKKFDRLLETEFPYYKVSDKKIWRAR